MAHKPTPTKHPTSGGHGSSSHAAHRHVSKATRKKISKSLTGHTVSKKTRAKISRSLKRTNRLKKAAAPAIAEDWILGHNDLLPTCGIVAIANHRWIATGYRMTDDEILSLYDQISAADGGVSLEEALEALGAEFYPVDRNIPGAVVAISTPHGPHAALSAGDRLVTWGGDVPWATQVEESLWVQWPCGPLGQA